MRSIDLNADMGEYADERQQQIEAALMPFLSSCSIACGGHAGDENTMRQTARVARLHGVSVGAHPAYPDREGFGRRPVDIAMNDLAHSIRLQIDALKSVLATENIPMRHVKAHGALYNEAAKNQTLADLVVDASGEDAIIVGPSGSALENAAKKAGIPFAAEGFVDRLYQPDGSLTPRKRPGAVIENVEARADQARAIALGEPLQSSNGAVSIKADTLCIHSDSHGAVETAQAVRATLKEAGIGVKPFSASPT
jgi:UPF0271 protein